MMDGSKSNTSSSQGNTSQDKYAPGTLDVSDPSGKRLDVTDKVLDTAKETVDMASKGAIPKIRHHLPKRITDAEFVPVEDDPNNIPVDTEIITDDENPFIDDDTYQDDTHIDDDSSATDIQTKPCGPVCNPRTEVNDPIDWIMASLKTIHNDMQLIKPDIEQIPVVRNKIQEIQQILGHIAGDITDQKTRIENMEKTLTTQRSDINRLTDIVMSYMNIPAEPKIISVAPTQPKVITTAEINITRLIEVISQKKNLTGEQEMILRNLITHKDKDIIITSLKDLGVKRPIMSGELELILQVDYGSSKGMHDVMKTLTGLIPEKVKAGCPPDCTMSADVSGLSKSSGKRANPFRLN